MKCQIPDIDDEDLDLAISAEIGAESRVFVSYQEGKLVAEIEQDAADLGTIVLERAYRPPELTTAGRDMQLVCNDSVLSDEEIIVTLNVMVEGSLPATKTITGNTVANPTVITTSAAHGLTSGNTITITGSDSTPTLNGTHVATVLSSTTLSVPVNVTVVGTAGTIQGPPGAAVADTATATFDPPDTAQDASFNFPTGLGVDIIPVTDATKNIRSVVSIASVAGGKAGNKFYVLALPDRDSYTEVMCATDKTIAVPTRKSIAIACRFNGARWVKGGRSEPPTAEFTGKYVSYGDGLPRVNGQRVTVMIESRKDDRILTERLILTGWRPTVGIKKGDGDAEAEASATGMYEIFCAFV